MHDRIYDACQALAVDPRPRRAIKLEPKQLKKYRLEIWPYRAIYKVDDQAKTVQILHIDHRKQVYR